MLVPILRCLDFSTTNNYPQPGIQDIKSHTQLNTSLGYWWNIVVEDGLKPKDKLSDSFAWVDVRDVALAHILALEKEEAGNERIIVCAGSVRWQDWGTLLRLRKSFTR